MRGHVRTFTKHIQHPVTHTGKLDREALPEPQVEHRVHAAPTTREEAALCAMWEEVLDVERVGIDDDWFELGGHSMLSMRLVNRL